jgi:hypothetical protein
MNCLYMKSNMNRLKNNDKDFWEANTSLQCKIGL